MWTDHKGLSLQGFVVVLVILVVVAVFALIGLGVWIGETIR